MNITEFKSNLNETEAAEFALLMAGDWPEKLSFDLRSRRQVASPMMVASDSVVFRALIENDWNLVTGWYRIRDDRMEAWLLRVVRESMQMRADEQATRIALAPNALHAMIRGEG